MASNSFVPDWEDKIFSLSKLNINTKVLKYSKIYNVFISKKIFFSDHIKYHKNILILIYLYLVFICSKSYSLIPASFYGQMYLYTSKGNENTKFEMDLKFYKLSRDQLMPYDTPNFNGSYFICE